MGSLTLKGGHITQSGHRIGMTSDQMTDYAAKLTQAVRDITTDSSFTAEQKAELVRNMPTMKDLGFYEFLNSQYRSGPELAKEINRLLSEKKTNKASVPAGVSKTTKKDNTPKEEN